MPYDERDSETGQFTPIYPREAFLDAVRTADIGITTSEVSDEVGCGYRLAFDRLEELEGDGQVASRDVGSSKLWVSTNQSQSEVSA